MVPSLRDLVAGHEDWLISRIMEYARRYDYIQYVSALHEAWRVSIAGLSASLIRVLERGDGPADIRADEDFLGDPVAAFAALEARRHRERGVSLVMFLGLMKYYRQTYVDLVREAGYPNEDEPRHRAFVERFFDRLEIGFCVEWAGLPESDQVRDLQAANRAMTNEKNKYLTIFESVPDPVVFLDAGHRIENLNQAAARLLTWPPAPGADSSGPEGADPPAWLLPELHAFASGEALEHMIERELAAGGLVRSYQVKLKRVLDGAGHFAGTIVILNDITERKRMEHEYRAMSLIDELTGLYNRRGFLTLARKQLHVADRTRRSLLLVFADLDGMKEINDTYGHCEGDYALVETASILQQTFRESDILARLGGDEFVVLAIQTSGNTPDSVMARLQANIAHHNRKQKHPYELAVSLGVARYDPRRRCSIETLLSRADQRMYEHKKAKPAARSSDAVIGEV
jgi:diguanylate cyclase (GGDEF)-like protein